ncbi:MAG TPA: plastocyanin/azurin family copper-binding protein [Ktedonobacterales bacterium]|nr:plastocyanin/azurin family copper-binding protein [Ktedonobacterales bacterium]
MFALRHIHPKRGIGSALVATLLFAALTAPVVAAKSAHETSGPRAWSVSAGVGTENHAIEGMVFLPGVITIDVGDSIVWRAGSGEIHTIVFPGAGGQIQPYNPGTYQPTSNTTYDGATYTASPVLTVLPDKAGVPFTATSYKLTFSKAGEYTYFCSVHPGMQGTVVVQPAGAAYPHTQDDYNRESSIQRERLIAQGYSLSAQAERTASNHLVVAGIGNDQVDVMRFVRRSVTIHAGESVTFTNLSMGPHTVTFGPEPANPGAINFPYGDPTRYDGSAPLNSGLMGVITPPTFTVTFTTPGVFAYKCALHDYMGMVGTVVVLPSSASR